MLIVTTNLLLFGKVSAEKSVPSEGFEGFSDEFVERKKERKTDRQKNTTAATTTTTTTTTSKTCLVVSRI